jgi:hypothetical protein
LKQKREREEGKWKAVLVTDTKLLGGKLLENIPALKVPRKCLLERM